MNVDFKGYSENVATFIADTAVTAGSLVKVTDDFKVSPCTSGDEIAGVCVSVRDGYAAVQLSGYVEVSANAKIPVGCRGISAHNGTTVKADNDAKKYLVVNSTAAKAGFIL